MKRIALLLVLALSLPLTARADDASRRDKAKELLILLHTDRLLKQMMDGVMAQTTSMTRQMVGTKSLSPAQQTRMEEFQKQLVAMVEANLSYQSLEPDYIKLYADNFTDEELDGILAFYKSPAGQSMIDKLPALTTQGLQLGQRRMSALIPQVQQMIADFAKNCTECAPEPAIAGVAGFANSPPPPVRLGNGPSDAAFAGQAAHVSSAVMAGNIVQRTAPIYPPIAKAAHVQGVVIMRAVIGKDGRIEKLATISGPPMLVSAAEDAVKHWVYKPYLLNGEPTEVTTTINVNFTFGNSSQQVTPTIPSMADGSSTAGGATQQ